MCFIFPQIKQTFSLSVPGGPMVITLKWRITSYLKRKDGHTTASIARITHQRQKHGASFWPVVDGDSGLSLWPYLGGVVVYGQAQKKSGPENYQFWCWGNEMWVPQKLLILRPGTKKTGSGNCWFGSQVNEIWGPEIPDFAASSIKSRAWK